jgi:putative transposase
LTGAERLELQLRVRAGETHEVAATQHGIVCCVSRRGNCWDNAVAERFFATLKA